MRATTAAAGAKNRGADRVVPLTALSPAEPLAFERDSLPAATAAAQTGTSVQLQFALAKARQNPARALLALRMYNLKADDAFQVAMACVTESRGAAKALLHPELLAKFSRDQIDELGATAMANAPLRVNGSKLVRFMSPARFQRALTDEVVPKLLEQHPERLVKAGDILRRLPEEERIRICSTILRERAHADRYFLLRSIGKLSVNETRSISPILLEVDPHACRTFQDKFTFHDKAEAAEWLKKSDLSRGVSWILRSDVFSPDEKLYHFRRGIRAGYYHDDFDDLQNVVPRQERDLYISIFKRADSYNGSLCSTSYLADYASLGEVPPEVLEAASALLTRYPEAFYGLSSEKAPSILSQIVKTMPWAEAYQRVEGYQARSARKEFDPWIHEFAPLVAHAIKSGLLDPTKPADGHLLADFIQRVGMINAPLLLEGFVTFKRSKTWDEIPKEQRDAYASFPNFTPELFKSSPSAAVELLLQGYALLRRAILDEAKSPDGTARIADYLRFPYLINSFRSLKGATSFERQADPAEIVQRCIRATRDGRGSESRIVHREIAIMVREREEPSQEAALLQEKKFSELISKKHVAHAWDTLKSLIREHRVVSDDLTGYVASSIKSLEDELRQKAAGLRQKAEGAKDMVATNLRTHAEQYERGADALEAITLPAFIERNPEQREAYLQAAIEAVTTSVPFRTEIRDRTLRVLSFDHMYSRGADQLRWKLGQIASADTSLEVLEYAAEFLVNHVHQHYLAHGSRLALRDSGLSDKACSDLRTIWDLTKVSDNPLIKTHRTLLRIANDQQSDREGRTAVTFVPLGAFGRVWSGDFGDACFTRLHQQLADGYFPRVTAYALVTGRNTPNEKINGSVLLIETTTPNGDPVLMIRANNPSKNLLRKVDAEDLVVQFADHVESLTRPEATTDGKPFRYIVLPLDHNSESSTNRQEVNEAIWMLYGNAEKLELVDEPETNFNGYYDNWNSQGEYPCGIIYENTDIINENTDFMTQKQGVESQRQPHWFSELLDQFRTARTKRAS